VNEGKMDKRVKWEGRMSMIQPWNRDTLLEMVLVLVLVDEENEDSHIEDNIVAESPLNSVAWNEYSYRH
jgi:hypothetical protein